LLDDAVEAFLSAFCTQFPEENVKPKMHFLVHYGNHCRTFGPLIQYWSFRFEGKHGYFKDLACRLKCRKNVLLTLARKHQYYHCWHLQQTRSYLHDALLSNSRGKHVELSALSADFQTILKPAVMGSKTVFQATFAEIDGIKYECGLSLVTGLSNFELCLTLIRSLFIVNGTLYVIGSKLENQTYWKHFHVYVGTFSSTCSLFSASDFIDPFPLSVYTSSDDIACVVLKHSVS